MRSFHNRAPWLTRKQAAVEADHQQTCKGAEHAVDLDNNTGHKECST
jgi:hypothetical protein